MKNINKEMTATIFLYWGGELCWMHLWGIGLDALLGGEIGWMQLWEDVGCMHFWEGVRFVVYRYYTSITST